MREPFIITVQDGCAVMIHACENLAFGIGDLLLAVKVFDMDRLYRCDDRHVRPYLFG